jgi:hypothetical protein
MPFLHWQIYTFLKIIFNLFAEFATIFENVNVVAEARPLDDLNIKPLQKAVKVMRALIDQLDLAQSTNSPIPNISSMVASYSTSPWSNTPPSVPVLSNVPTPEVAKKPYCEKHNHVSPDKKAKAAANQCQN